MKAKLQEIVGQTLSDFKVIAMTEVYYTNEEGIRQSTIGFFKDPKIAEAFAGAQRDANYFKTVEKFLLTNGKVGYVVGNPGDETVTLFDNEAERVEIKKRALAKLTETERAVLGLILST